VFRDKFRVIDNPGGISRANKETKVRALVSEAAMRRKQTG